MTFTCNSNTFAVRLLTEFSCVSLHSALKLWILSAKFYREKEIELRKFARLLLMPNKIISLPTTVTIKKIDLQLYQPVKTLQNNKRRIFLVELTFSFKKSEHVLIPIIELSSVMFVILSLNRLVTSW